MTTTKAISHNPHVPKIRIPRLATLPISSVTCLGATHTYTHIHLSILLQQPNPTDIDTFKTKVSVLDQKGTHMTGLHMLLLLSCTPGISHKRIVYTCYRHRSRLESTPTRREYGINHTGASIRVEYISHGTTRPKLPFRSDPIPTHPTVQPIVVDPSALVRLFLGKRAQPCLGS